MEIAKKIFIVLAIILVPIILALLCYGTMSLMNEFSKYVKTWLGDNTLKNVFIHIFRFFINMFKYTTTLLLMIIIIKILLKYSNAIIITIIVLFTIYCVVFVIFGPDYYYLIRFNYYRAFKESMLIELINGFKMLFGGPKFGDVPYIIVDLFPLLLYYIGAIYKPLKIVIKRLLND